MNGTFTLTLPSMRINILLSKGCRAIPEPKLYLRYYRQAMGFTVYGESCYYDTCELRDGYDYTWCHKFNESTCSDANYCTLSSNSTPYGDKCVDKCAKRGQKYYYCHKDSHSNLRGYCTPQHLIEQLRQNQVMREHWLLSFE